MWYGTGIIRKIVIRDYEMWKRLKEANDDARERSKWKAKQIRQFAKWLVFTIISWEQGWRRKPALRSMKNVVHKIIMEQLFPCGPLFSIVHAISVPKPNIVHFFSEYILCIWNYPPIFCINIFDAFKIITPIFFYVRFTCTKIYILSLIHIWRCRRIERCRSRWSPYH